MVCVIDCGTPLTKRATAEWLDIPNILSREFDVPAPNQMWCGDITYIWAQDKWHYLAVVLDPQDLLFHSDQGSKRRINVLKNVLKNRGC